jgi:ribosomal protein S20
VRGLHRRITGQASHEADAASLISAIDKAAKRGMIHRNAANRRKARLARARAAAKK